MAAPIGARSHEVVKVLEEPSSETLPRTSNFAFVVLQNHPPNSPVVLARGAAMPSKRGQDHRTNWQRKENYTMRPLALAREEPGTGAYIDTEGPRIENKLERACGTNGWAVICP